VVIAYYRYEPPPSCCESNCGHAGLSAIPSTLILWYGPAQVDGLSVDRSVCGGVLQRTAQRVIKVFVVFWVLSGGGDGRRRDSNRTRGLRQMTCAAGRKVRQSVSMKTLW
jgi:hypothetical protein